MISELMLLVLLIALNAFFAASEIALISLNENKLRYMAEEGNKKASQLLKILGDPSKFLATIQIGITLAGFLARAFAVDTSAEPLVELMKMTQIPLSETVLKNIAVIFITLDLS